MQVIDPAALRTVRRANLRRAIWGISVTGQWLIVRDYYSSEYRLTVFSLPGLELRDQVVMHSGWPRADSDGMVYVPVVDRISMVKITDTGNITVVGNLTAGGRLHGRLRVAVGPQPGQLCVGRSDPPRLHIINITTDSVIHTLAVPAGAESVQFVAAVASGQILIKDDHENQYMYTSVSEPVEMLTDTPVTGRWVVMLGHNNQFLVGDWRGSGLYVMDEEGNWQTVNGLNGEVTDIHDIAVWGSVCGWPVTGAL